MSSRASTKRRPASKAYGIVVGYESQITPAMLIAAGFRRDQKNGHTKADNRRFCEAMRISRDLWQSIRVGRREPTAAFRAQASRVLQKPEELLFRRVIEGRE